MYRIAADIDGVLLSHTPFFLNLYKQLDRDNNMFGILTARGGLDTDELKDELLKIGIKIDFVIQKPEQFKDIPNGIFKAVLCNKFEVDVLFDDFQGGSKTMIADFVKYNQNTLVFMPLAYNFID